MVNTMERLMGKEDGSSIETEKDVQIIFDSVHHHTRNILKNLKELWLQKRDLADGARNAQNFPSFSNDRR